MRPTTQNALKANAPKPDEFMYGYQDDYGDWHDFDFPKKLSKF